MAGTHKLKNASKQAQDTRRITSAHVDSNIRVNNECEKSQNHQHNGSNN